MRHKIFECALGEVELVDCLSGIYLGWPYNPMSCWRDDTQLPGGKFTAREFLEEFLWAYSQEQELSRYEIRRPLEKITREAFGTFYFTTEAVEMAKRAIKEWGKK